MAGFDPKRTTAIGLPNFDDRRVCYLVHTVKTARLDNRPAVSATLGKNVEGVAQ
jgi:hypothetical protein